MKDKPKLTGTLMNRKANRHDLSDVAILLPYTF